MGYYGRILRGAQSLWPAGNPYRDTVNWNAVMDSLMTTGTANANGYAFTLSGGNVTRAAFNPVLLGGGSALKGWFKADSLALANDAPVSTWADSSGLANDATQAGANRPVFKTAVQNSLPGVLFTSASSHSMNANGVATGGAFNGTNAPFTYMAVFRQTSLTATHVFCSHGTTAGGATMVNALRTSTVPGSSYQLGRGDASTFTAIDSQPLAPDIVSNYIFSGVFNGSTGECYRNGTQIIAATDLSKAGAQTFNRFSLGCRVSNGTAGLFLGGYLFEVMAFAVALSTAERQAAEWEMGSKWGITVA